MGLVTLRILFNFDCTESSKNLQAFACARRRQLESLALCSAKHLPVCIVRCFGCQVAFFFLCSVKRILNDSFQPNNNQGWIVTLLGERRLFTVDLFVLLQTLSNSFKLWVNLLISMSDSIPWREILQELLFLSGIFRRSFRRENERWRFFSNR